MMVIIFLVVAVYSCLMVWVLAKVGSVPARSVIDMVKGNVKPTPSQNRKSYERTISAR